MKVLHRCQRCALHPPLPPITKPGLPTAEVCGRITNILAALLFYDGTFLILTVQVLKHWEKKDSFLPPPLSSNQNRLSFLDNLPEAVPASGQQMV